MLLIDIFVITVSQELFNFGTWELKLFFDSRSIRKFFADIKIFDKR